MTAPDHDGEFEAFLKRRTLLPTMADKLEPPARLDEIVLNQAREAIHAKRGPVRAARWARPVALAATILLCLSIALNVKLNTSRPDANASRVTPALAKADKSATVEPQPAPAESVPQLSADDAAPAPPGAFTQEEAKPTAKPSAAPAAARARDELRRMAEPAAPAGAPASNASPVVAQAGASASNASPGTAGRTYSDSTALADQSASNQPASAPAAPAATDRAAGALETEARQSAALAGRKADAQQQAHPQDPKVWLQQIKTLRVQGRTAQADAEMQRFRAVFPTYPVPPDRPDTH